MRREIGKVPAWRKSTKNIKVTRSALQTSLLLPYPALNSRWTFHFPPPPLEPPKILSAIRESLKGSRTVTQLPGDNLIWNSCFQRHKGVRWSRWNKILKYSGSRQCRKPRRLQTQSHIVRKGKKVIWRDKSRQVTKVLLQKRSPGNENRDSVSVQNTWDNRILLS